MYKKASKFQQSSPHTTVGRDQSLVPARTPTVSAKYAEVMGWLVERSDRSGATELIKSMPDYRLARLIVTRCVETIAPNDWLNSVCMEVDDCLSKRGKLIHLSDYQRRVAETVIPELINRARTPADPF